MSSNSDKELVCGLNTVNQIIISRPKSVQSLYVGEALNHLKCAFASENIGNTFNGQIIGVTNFGIFIHLKEINIEGLCHIKYLPRNEYYVFDEDSKMLQSNSSRHSYSLGDEFKVTIEKVEVFSQKIDLRLVK